MGRWGRRGGVAAGGPPRGSWARAYRHDAAPPQHRSAGRGPHAGGVERAAGGVARGWAARATTGNREGCVREPLNTVYGVQVAVIRCVREGTYSRGRY